MKFSALVAVVQGCLCVNINEVWRDNTSRSLDEVEGKIVGGKPIAIEKLPFAVQFYNFGNMCSGVILNSWSVLTAAHCFDNNKNIFDMVIEAGYRYMFDYEADVYEVKDFVIHKNYSQAMRFACDIAIIFVNRQFTFGSKVKKALLVTHSKWMKGTEKKFVVNGWGWIKYGGPLSTKGLQKTYLRYVPKGDCEKMHDVNLTADMFCLYGDGVRDTCKGDSGGGVLWNGVVVGIVSHGDGCSRKNSPSIYSNVWYFKKWIRVQIIKFIRRFCREEVVNPIIPS
ncbi:unnamed protein product [Parnassius mnemosyne]|uniref:Peptidase S1 domain-containing protein n=1 Tax=Parnassius mnemosyne TaxID=213953 RepID=A0AAV1M5E6_9NEOP